MINLGDFSVTAIGFSDFNAGGARHGELPLGKMVLSGVNASVARDLEPEYIAVRGDGKRAYVSLQENNAIAVINLETNTVQKIIGLGFKDHGLPGNELDASQQDGVNLRAWPVMGMYIPDSLSTLDYNGRAYVVTANEGDSREDWLNGLNDSVLCAASGYYHKSNKCRDELALKDIADSDLVMGPMLAGLNTDSTLGRLKFSYQATKAFNGGVTENRLYAYGCRSFAIRDAETGEQVFDSGNGGGAGRLLLHLQNHIIGGRGSGPFQQHGFAQGYCFHVGGSAWNRQTFKLRSGHDIAMKVRRNLSLIIQSIASASA